MAELRRRPIALQLLVLATLVGSATARPSCQAGQPVTATAGELEQMSNRPLAPIVLIGASYAAGWHLPDVVGRPVMNKGVAGEESWQMLKRFDRDVIALNPSVVIVWGYINDVFRAPRASMDDALARCRRSVEQMVHRARAAGIEVILATEVTVRQKDDWRESVASWVGWLTGKQSYQDFINARVVGLNAWLREFASREGLLVLDLQPVLADESGLRRFGYAKSDGSHITPEGYAALTRYAVPLLDARVRTATAGRN